MARWQVITSTHITLHKLDSFEKASTSDHKPVRGILTARLSGKIHNDTMPSAPGSPEAKADLTKVRRQSTGQLSHTAVRTAVVRFSHMRARGLKAADLNGKSDPYLKFQAVPFCDYLVQPAYTSKVRKATLDPDWRNLDVPELHTVLRTNEQLKELVIAVSVWDHDLSSPDDPLGDVLIPIGSFVPADADPDACTDIPPQKFNKRITLHGQQVHNGVELGYVRGMVSVTWQWDAGSGGVEKRDECAVQ